jgi:hypothetical protein
MIYLIKQTHNLTNEIKNLKIISEGFITLECHIPYNIPNSTLDVRIYNDCAEGTYFFNYILSDFNFQNIFINH